MWFLFLYLWTWTTICQYYVTIASSGPTQRTNDFFIQSKQLDKVNLTLGQICRKRKAFLRKNGLIGHRSIFLQSVCAKITSSRTALIRHRSASNFWLIFHWKLGCYPFLWHHIRTVFIENFLFILNYVATLTQEIQFLEFMGGSNVPQAFPNYLIWESLWYVSKSFISDCTHPPSLCFKFLTYFSLEAGLLPIFVTSHTYRIYWELFIYPELCSHLNARNSIPGIYGWI